ncbi:hypothetical protein LJC17_00970 [Acholeplasma sp. OttesenSCG-928-E16]|nr:hypothetical protein [Acholeplasma sp. OttesenSCG-928-E16]
MFKKRRQQTFYLIVTSILMALIILMAFIPYIGYIAIIPGAIEVTLIHIPVLIGLMILPFAHSLALGTTFGLSSLLVAFQRPTLPNIPFQNPLVSVLPRILFVLVAFFLFYGLKWINKKFKYGSIVTYGITILFTIVVVMLGFYYLGTNFDNNDFMVPLFMIIGAVILALMLTFYFFAFKKNDSNYATTPATLILGTLFHTIFVLIALAIAKPSVLGDGNFLTFYLSVMTANGLLEVIAAVLVGAPIVLVLQQRFKELRRDYPFSNDKDESVNHDSFN